MNEQQFNQLKEIGFLEDAEPTSDKLDWNEMFGELKEFHSKHGHCNVPHIPKSRLRNWIRVQRAHFERFKKKQVCILDPERIAKLSSLGFSFTTEERMGFDDRAVQWLQYRNQHGRDPPSATPGIGSWLRKIRRYHDAFQQGEKVPVTAAQFDQLEEWGFKFERLMKMPVNVTNAKPWEERFDELVQYKEEHGHVNVPQKCEYPSYMR